MPSVVELFAGGGGAALGLKAAGFDHLACIENNPDAITTLNSAGFRVLDRDATDVARLATSELLEPDLLWSSFPCQAWSKAGKREGASGLNLWPTTLEWIDKISPGHFIAENVTGLTMHTGACKKGCLGAPACPRAYFDVEIMGGLADRFPFTGARIIDCADLGLPQRRRRVIIQGGHSPLSWPEPTHGSPREAAQGDLFGRVLLPWNTVGAALGLGQVIGGGRNPQNSQVSELRSFRDLTDEPCTTIAASQIGNAGPWITSRQHSARPGAVCSLDAPLPTLCAGSNRDNGFRVHFRKAGHPELLDSPSAAVTATEYKGTNGKESSGWTAKGGPSRASDTLWLSTGRRRLTPEECAKLQGFPPDHQFFGSLSARYRQIGNAVPPVLAESLGRLVR